MPNLHLPRCFESTAVDSHKSISVEAREMEAAVKLLKAAATDEAAVSRQDVFAAAEPPALADNCCRGLEAVQLAIPKTLERQLVSLQPLVVRKRRSPVGTSCSAVTQGCKYASGTSSLLVLLGLHVL